MNETTVRNATIPLVIAIVVALAIGIGSVVIALSATKEAQTDAKQIHVLQAQLKADAPALSSTSSSVSAEQTKITAIEARASKTASSLNHVESCLPELQEEMHGLHIATSTKTFGENTLLTSAYLESGQGLSSYCKPTLEKAAG